MVRTDSNLWPGISCSVWFSAAPKRMCDSRPCFSISRPQISGPLGYESTMTVVAPCSRCVSNITVPPTPRIDTHIRCFVQSLMALSGQGPPPLPRPARSTCEYMTPFGSAVEPEVLKMIDGTPAGTSGIWIGWSLPSDIICFSWLSFPPNGGSTMLRKLPPSLRAKGAHCIWSHTMSDGSYRATMPWQSHGRRSVARGTKVTPSFRQLRRRTTSSGRLSTMVTRRSPTPTPMTLRPRARRLALLSRLSNVKRCSEPTPSKTSASRSPKRPAASAHAAA
mmetsp:Transcript_24586/g.77585  ORF Transcript_24586/g.77585 Transcript_24586/m.77585 type:complete len:278 (+) Transcript_24586:352-1185(+)